jgi:undecaprenyl-diphosphatase
MTIVQAVVLGFVQGLTEFLPVSSSGHLILVPELLGWPDQGLAFDAMMHLGTALAALWFFRADILTLVKSFATRRPDPDTARFRLAIIISMIPAAIVGILAKDLIESTTRHAAFVAVNLVLWSVVLLVADFIASRRTQGNSVPTPLRAFLIGLAQACALLPGTSRSGATISVGIFTGLDRVSAVRFSFVAGIPLILAAGLMSLPDLAAEVSAGVVSWPVLLIGFATAFLGGVLAIRVLLSVLNKHGLTVFAVYRILLAAFVLWLL